MAIHDDTSTTGPAIAGVARLCKTHGASEAEFAVLVADHWQGRGTGTRLLTMLVDIGRQERLFRIVGMMLSDNFEMRHVCEQVG